MGTAFSNRINYLKWFRKIPLVIAFLALMVLTYEFGFETSVFDRNLVHHFYMFTISIGIFFIIGRYLQGKNRPNLKVLIIDIFLVLFLSFHVLNSFINFNEQLFPLRYQGVFTFLAIFIIFIRELFVIRVSLKHFTVNPAQLFISSFFSLIILGSLLLLLPNATYNGIEVIDALFTSTSAVCVTGLIVVDTGTYFTGFGQFIIIFLVQAGGSGS